jgi:U3 small nucleolar RNA-associated protein 5
MSRQATAGPSRIKQTVSTQAPPAPPSLSSFSPSRTQYALAQPVLGSADKVTVWDVATDRVVAEWEVEQAGKASTLCWASVAGNRKPGKRRRKSGPEDDAEDVVLIATKSSSLVVYSPRRSQVVRKLNLPSTATALWSDDNGVVVATSTSIHVLSAEVTSISHTFALPPNTPSPTSIALLASSTPDTFHALIASSSVVTLHLELATSTTSYTSSPLPVSTSSVISLLPLPITSQGTSFLVVAEDDRTVSQYTIPSPTKSPKLSYRYASPTLSPAHSLALSSTLLSVLHQSGEISLFTLPTELDLARPKSDSKPSTVKLVEGKADQLSRVCRAEFSADANGTSVLLCGRMAGAGRVKWFTVNYELPEGGIRPSTLFKCDAHDLVGKAAGSNGNGTTQRYHAPTEVAEMPDADIDEAPASTLPTDVDMADLSLGERLLALPNGDSSLPNGTTDASKSKPSLEGPANAASLTRLLVQALHTSDPALLTLCLSHRDPILIRNTIRKMPAQMALPLLKACVERLGQGKHTNRRGGGRGSAQSEQHARGTVEWVKGVLVERGSILMTVSLLPL